MSLEDRKFDSDGIRHEAAAWVLQLEQGPLGKEDRAALEEWCGRSPAHAKALSAEATAWLGTENALDRLFETDAELVKTSVRTLSRPINSGQSTKRYIVGRLVATATVLAIMFIGITEFTPSNQFSGKNEPFVVLAPLTFNTYATAIGEQAEFKLHDGSIVHLNTNSEVKVSYQKKRRLVKLTRGEAHFDITSDPARPFDVIAASKQISAVGTAFAVRLTASGVNITVTEGVVGILSPEPEQVTTIELERPTLPYQALLEPFEKMVIEASVSTITKVKSDTIEKELSWRAGRLHFDEENLQYVIDEVSRYTDQVITLSDPSIADLKIGGIFKAGETEALLKALELSFDLKIERINETNVSISRSDDMNG